MGIVQRTREVNGGWVALLLAVCAVAGVAAGVKPAYGLGVVAVLGFTMLVLANATWGLILFTVLSFLDVLRSGGATDSLMKVAGLLLFGSWLAGASVRRRRLWDVSPFQASPVMSLTAVAFVAWSALSVAWAYNAGDAVTNTYRYLLVVLLVPVVFGTVRTRDHVRWLAAAFLVGAVISTLYGFAIPSSNAGLQPGQLTGSVGDANEEAAVLVAAIALGFGLLDAWRARPWLRLAVAGSLLICFAGVVNTLSRSGLIALACMLLAAVVFGGRWRPRAALLLAVAVVGGLGYFTVIAPLSARQRVTMSDTSGRSTIWAVGWRMVQANPIGGVGAGNFPDAAIHYLQVPGGVTRADLIVDTPKVAHNIYLEMLADLGVPGLLAFLGIIGGSVAAAIAAAQRFERAGDRELELMARCVVFALVGFLASDFFLSGEFSKQLWLTFALGPTLLAIAASRPVREVADADDHEVVSGPPHLLIRSA
jgi:putative inorganic carbon (HCO3(-)) transporter